MLTTTEGTIKPGRKSKLFIEFIPNEARTYRVEIQVKVEFNRKSTPIYLFGEGIMTPLVFNPSMITIGPVMPFTYPPDSEKLIDLSASPRNTLVSETSTRKSSVISPRQESGRKQSIMSQSNVSSSARKPSIASPGRKPSAIGETLGSAPLEIAITSGTSVNVQGTGSVIDGSRSDLGFDESFSTLNVTPVFIDNLHEKHITITNTSSIPIEFYSVDFDKKYLAEEEILSSLSSESYDKDGIIRCNVRLPGEGLSSEIMSTYKKLQLVKSGNILYSSFLLLVIIL